MMLVDDMDVCGGAWGLGGVAGGGEGARPSRGPCL
jgi:hypothetical protein